MHAEMKHWLAKLYCWFNLQMIGLLVQVALKVSQKNCLPVDGVDIAMMLKANKSLKLMV